MRASSILSSGATRVVPVSRTGPDGRFALENLPPGRYAVSANHPDYARQTFGMPERGNEAAGVEVGGSERIINIDFALIRAGEIRGRVSTESGTPLEGLMILAYSVGGRPAGGMGRADKEGRYRLTQLPPGDYHVGTGLGLSYGRGNRPNERLGTSYFPGVRRQADASAVGVAARQVVEDIDFAVLPLRHSTVAGRLAGSEPLSHDLQLVLQPSLSGSQQRLTAKDVKEDGSFTFAAVPNGPYTIVAESRGSQGLEIGTTAVDVQDDDVLDLVVTLRPAATLSGRVVADRGETVPDHAFFVTARLGSGYRSGVQATVKADGRFTLEGLFGERTLHLLGLGLEWRIVRIESDGRPVDRFVFLGDERLSNVVVVIGRQ